MNDLHGDIKSLRELVSSALYQASGLLSSEMALARAEITEKIAQVGRGAVLILAGALILAPAITLILLAIAAGVMELGLSPAISYLITGAGAAVVAGLVIVVGMGRLSGEQLKPRATIGEIRRNGEVFREMAR